MSRSAALAFIFLGSAAAQATTFNYSYSFVDGTTVTGSFDGGESGGLVTGLSNISVLVNGTALNRGFKGYAFDTTTKEWTPTAAVASFDGYANNFIFSDSSREDFNSNNMYFAFVTASSGATTMSVAEMNYGRLLQNIAYDGSLQSRWHLQAVNAIPEPETYAMLLAGLGLMGALARRRKQT
jgi:hypothetical protein